MSDGVILKPGELHIGKRFGPDTVNRGAALFECEWDGGRFEAGLFTGGIFRCGQFLGGVFIGGIFLNGDWLGGTWECGFDGNGIYHPRNDIPLLHGMPRLLIASPHRYPDLARLWHRFIMDEAVPAFQRLHLDVEVNIFCDANADQFQPSLFPGARLTPSDPGIRDFMEFYDATLAAPYDFILFLDADTFLLDGNWAASYFRAFNDPNVAAVSYVPRKGEPAIFALLCRTVAYRALPPPALACRYEFPHQWPHGHNPQPGDVAARELAAAGRTIINISEDESLRKIANFRSTTGIRSSREHMTRAAGEEVFYKLLEGNSDYFVAAHDNVLLGSLYETFYHEPFAPDAAGTPLAASLTLAELRNMVERVRDQKQLELLQSKFQRSRQNILRMAAHLGVEIPIPGILPHEAPILRVTD